MTTAFVRNGTENRDKKVVLDWSSKQQGEGLSRARAHGGLCLILILIRPILAS